MICGKCGNDDEFQMVFVVGKESNVRFFWECRLCGHQFRVGLLFVAVEDEDDGEEVLEQTIQ